MNFAALGDDPAMLPLLKAVLDSPEHQLTHAVIPRAETAAELITAAPSLRLVPEWEELLNAENLEAVIVAGDGETLLTGTKQLAAAGISILLFPRVQHESTFIYELTLIRDDTNVRLVPVFLRRVHPQVLRLKSLLAEGAIGKILHFQLERESRADDDGPPLLKLDTVNDALLYDVDLLRDLGGEYTRITALHSGAETGKISLATVTLAGTDVPEASWTMRPVATASNWKLTAVGESGQLTLSAECPPDERSQEPSLITLAGKGVPAESSASDSAAENAAEVLRRFADAVGGENSRPDWTDLTRDFELVDATARSLRRRRTIDLHFETASERSQFKTQMTAIGCGLMSMTMVSVIFLLIASKVFNLHPAIMSVARIGVFAPLVLFLLLQLLLFISRPSVQPGEGEKKKDSAGQPTDPQTAD
ncbi:MAG: Gfo/Idh/MocA family oxidoreductase [Planctomycetes bacterium]|nr:Gfo/Idh/MocA family oxidoreductase [Planctomycetota bacterium]